MRKRYKSIRGLVAVVLGSVIVVAHGNALADQGGDQALHDAERMIAQCLDYAVSQKYPALSVAVIDPSGALMAFKREDGASAASADAALLKARTAMRLNVPTAVLALAIAGDTSTRDAFLIMQLTTLPGGIPISDEGAQTSGAIGVSGGEADQDAECARRAIEPKQTKKN